MWNQWLRSEKLINVKGRKSRLPCDGSGAADMIPARYTNMPLSCAVDPTQSNSTGVMQKEIHFTHGTDYQHPRRATVSGAITIIYRLLQRNMRLHAWWRITVGVSMQGLVHSKISPRSESNERNP